jgi:hypothetical protein
MEDIAHGRSERLRQRGHELIGRFASLTISPESDGVPFLDFDGFDSDGIVFVVSAGLISIGGGGLFGASCNAAIRRSSSQTNPISAIIAIAVAIVIVRHRIDQSINQSVGQSFGRSAESNSNTRSVTSVARQRGHNSRKGRSHTRGRGGSGVSLRANNRGGGGRTEDRRTSTGRQGQSAERVAVQRAVGTLTIALEGDSEPEAVKGQQQRAARAKMGQYQRQANDRVSSCGSALLK